MTISFEKMSKSKGNGVAPDIMAEKYGVDTLRLALMFGGPPESDLNFDENFLQSMKGFLDKVAKTGETVAMRQIQKSKREIQEIHRDKLTSIYGLLSDYELKLDTQRFFHVAIARCMELNNLLAKETDQDVHILGYIYLVQALFPFVPHLASELWSKMGHIVESLGLYKDIQDQVWDNIAGLLE